MNRSFVTSSLLVAFAVFTGACTAESLVEPSEASETGEEALVSLSLPRSLATTTEAGGLRISATHVYFRGDDGKSIRRVAKSGGASSPVFVTTGRVEAFVLDETHVYAVIDQYAATGNSDFAEIVRVPLAGGQVEVKLGGSLRNARIAVDATHVWVGALGKISRFPKEGPFGVAPEEIADAPNLSAIAVDASSVYWADMGPGNPAIGCNMGDGAIRAKSKTGGFARVVAGGQDCPLSLALEGSTLYFGSFFGPARKVSTFGGFVTTISTKASPEVAADASGAYLVSPATTGFQLRSVNKLSSFLDKDYVGSRVAADKSMHSIAVDGAHVFYEVTDNETNETRVLRLAK